MRRLIYLLHTTPAGFALEMLLATGVAAAIGVSTWVLVVFGLLIVPSFVVGDMIVVASCSRYRLSYLTLDVLSTGLAVIGWALWKPELGVPAAAGALLYCVLMRAARVLVGLTGRPWRVTPVRRRRRRRRGVPIGTA